MISEISAPDSALETPKSIQDIIHHDGDIVHLTTAINFLRNKGYDIAEKDVAKGVYSYKSLNGEHSNIIIRNYLAREVVVIYTSEDERRKSEEIIKGLRRILEQGD
ncbi:MAG: hypothetical protein WD876_01260 [Candidatus Pacearchaeota archaeon]